MMLTCHILFSYFQFSSNSLHIDGIPLINSDPWMGGLMFYIGHLQTNIYQLPVSTSHCVSQQTPLLQEQQRRKSSGHFVRPLSRGAREGFRKETIWVWNRPIEVTLPVLIYMPWLPDGSVVNLPANVGGARSTPLLNISEEEMAKHSSILT